MEETAIDSGQHAGLTAQYGQKLDELDYVVGQVLDVVEGATSAGILGDFSSAWLEAARRVIANAKQTQTALHEVQELLGQGRNKYVATEADNTRFFHNKSFTNLA